MVTLTISFYQTQEHVENVSVLGQAEASAYLQVNSGTRAWSRMLQLKGIISWPNVLHSFSNIIN